MHDVPDALDLGNELLWTPLRVVPPHSWAGHVPFAFWLVKVLRPNLFVELGTHSGNSYAAFCQAIDALDVAGRAYAVDTWKGDEHAGTYGEEVFADLSAFNAAHFEPFSNLLRTTFDDARGYFADDSVDLLHIDGMHSYEAVQHDFETWRGALTRRGVAVFHDTAVRERGFGVWRLWRELSMQFPCFEFDHSYGLGVLGVGPDQPAPLQCLFELGRDGGRAAAVRRTFAARGESFWRQAQLAARDQQLVRLAADVGRADVEAAEIEARTARRDAEREREAGQLRAELERLRRDLGWKDEVLRVKEQVVRAKDGLTRALDDALQARDLMIRHRDRLLHDQRSRLEAEIRRLDAVGSEQARSAREEVNRTTEEARRREEASLHALALSWEARALAERTQLVEAFRTSTSWRLTGPLRAATRLARRATGRGTLEPLLPAPSRMPEAPAPVATGDAAAWEATGAVEVPISFPVPDSKAALRALLATRLELFLAGSGRLALPRRDNPDVSIILVLFNQAELTFGCLSSIAESLAGHDLAVEVIILDNGSDDATGALLDRLDDATLVRHWANLHFLRGVNRAAKEARGRHVLLLNNDAQLLPGSLEAAVRTLDSDPGIGAVGGRVILPDGTLQEAGSIIWNDGTCQGYGRGRQPTDPEFMFRRDVDYCSGVFLLTPRAVFERLGGLDDRYAPAYYEETDYCARLWQADLRVVFEPEAAVLHYEFGSAATTGQALALQNRNWQVFRRRHATWLAGQLPPTPENALAARTARTGGKRLLVLEDRVPKVELGSGYPRAHDILRELVAQGAELTLFPMFRHPETWDGVRRAVGTAVEVFIRAQADQLGMFLRSRRGHYDAVLVCRPHNMRALQAVLDAEPELLGDTAILYDAEAIFARRDLIRDALLGREVPPDEARQMVADEVALALPARAVTSVNPVEQSVFRQHGVEPVFLLGMPATVDPAVAPFSERADIVFLGAIHDDNAPNADSVRWFAAEILPRVRRALGEDVRLKVVGLNQAATVAALDGAEVELLGQVEDLRPVFERARIMVVPTRFAAGTPQKLLQAAALGVPTVVTGLIAEQTGWEPRRDLLAGSTAEEFAAACVELYRDEALWSTVRAGALARVEEECSPASFRKAVRQLLALVPARDRATAGVPAVPASGDDEGGEPGFVGRPAEADYSLAVPFSYAPAPLRDPPSVAVVCHLFYPELAAEIGGYLRSLPFPADLFLSTDTEGKRDDVAASFEAWRRGTVEVRVTPNRGRDIAPKLVGFRDVHERYEYVLHVHSKMSRHDRMLAPWRGFLLENLLGSAAIVHSIFELFARQPGLGMVAPQHYENVRPWLDWGGNYRAAQSLARRMGIALPPGHALDFPSGSMFWARTAALRPLLDLELGFEDFQPEAGQTDSTVAHAVERLYFLVCEKAGYSWIKVANPALHGRTDTILEVGSPGELDEISARHEVVLSGAEPPPVAEATPPVVERVAPGLVEVLRSRRLAAPPGGVGTREAAHR